MSLCCLIAVVKGSALSVSTSRTELTLTVGLVLLVICVRDSFTGAVTHEGLQIVGTNVEKHQGLGVIQGDSVAQSVAQ